MVGEGESCGGMTERESCGGVKWLWWVERELWFEREGCGGVR